MIKEDIADLKRFVGQKLRIKFIGGREVIGVLKGFDQLLNLVLENCVENLRDPEDNDMISNETREIGTVVCRGVNISTINPADTMTVIENPYSAAAEAEI